MNNLTTIVHWRYHKNTLELPEQCNTELLCAKG